MKNNKSTTAHSPKELLTELQALVTEAEQMIGDTAGDDDVGTGFQSGEQGVHAHIDVGADHSQADV